MKLTERHVQAVWYDAALRPRNLYTRRGSEIRVISPGEWNLGEGPDFHHAVLELGKERRRLVGDVEVHMCPSDWDIHGHGTDPNYRNVIAHVTWGCGPDPASLPAGAVTIWLGRFRSASFSPNQIDLGAYPYSRLPLPERPCERWLEHNPDRTHEILADAGKHRLTMKAWRLAGRLAAAASRDVSRGQIYYEEVMTALGYKQNETPFRHVAERIPIDSWPKDLEAARNALLVAGSFEEWNRKGSRPNNTPERRLTRAADVFMRTPMYSYADIDDFSPESCRKIIKSVGLAMGAGRAAAILVNVIVPFAMAEERVDGVPEWLPPEDVSRPVRLTASRLFGRDHNPSVFYAANGLYIQGLLQIHRDCCSVHHPICDGTCPLVGAMRG